MATLVTLAGFWQGIWHWLSYWDTYLFLKINTIWTTPALDAFFPWFREAITWVPLYFFFLLFARINFKWKSLPWIFFVILNFALSDQISGFIKDWVARPRPCNDILVQFYMRLLIPHCPSSGSFTSSHATNHFAMAMFLWLTLRPILKKWAYLFFAWAALIAYGQVYVGVHYPIDVFCGAILGCLIGYATASFFNRRIGILNVVSEVPVTVE
jgi:undecaprenyl-diphosphatase